jgi:hypothetical protein
VVVATAEPFAALNAAVARAQVPLSAAAIDVQMALTHSTSFSSRIIRVAAFGASNPGIFLCQCPFLLLWPSRKPLWIEVPVEKPAAPLAIRERAQIPLAATANDVEMPVAAQTMSDIRWVVTTTLRTDDQ